MFCNLQRLVLEAELLRLCPEPVLTGTHARPSLQGGPCGVLAAVQGCVLQKLLFEGDSGASCAR